MNTTATIARDDQLAAREREFDRKARVVAIYFVTAMVLLGVYCVLALTGVLPGPPWDVAAK